MVNKVAIMRPLDRAVTRQGAVERIAKPIKKEPENDADEKNVGPAAGDEAE